MKTATFALAGTIANALQSVKSSIRRRWRAALIVYLMLSMTIPSHVLLGNPPPTPPSPPPSPPPCGGDPPPPCRRPPGEPQQECQDCADTDGGGGCATPPGTTSMPVYLRYGSASETATDLTLSAPAFAWSMTRTYSSQISGDTRLGTRWLGGRADQYLIQEGSNVSLLVNADSKLTFTGSGSPPTYTAPDDTTRRLAHDATNQIYILTDTEENIRWTFHDATVTNVKHRGKLKEESTRQWNSQGKAGFEYSYDTNGLLTTITTPDGQDYSIVFTYSSSRITKVEIKDAGGNLLEKVEYTYYQDVSSPSTDIGTTNDLVQVKVSRHATKDSTGATSIVRYTQYRYTTGSKLKAIYNHESIHRIIAQVSGIATPADLMTKADDFGTPDVKDFVEKSFEYYASATSTSSVTTPFASENLNSTYGGDELDETGSVKSETIGVGCNSCGSSNGGVKKTYFYTSLSQGTIDQNEVTRIIIEDTQDDNDVARYRVVYGLNDTGRILRKAFIQDPTGTPKYWCQSWKLETTGKQHRMAEARKPSAHAVTTAANLRDFLDPYDSETSSWTKDTNTLNSSDGMIEVYTFNSAGTLTDAKVKKGRTGTAYYTWAGDFGDGDGDAAGEDHANGTLQVAEYYYPTQTATRNDGKKTTYSYTFWDSADREVKTKTTTLPVVSTGQNGSGVATATIEYHDNLGRLRWTKDGEGYINYQSYNPVTGDVAYMAVDVDPASPGSDVTSGSSGNWDAWTVGDADDNKPTRDSGLPAVLHLATKTYYDAQDRQTQTVEPGGAQHYVAYENLRTISFPYWDSTNSKTLLPISVTKLNDAGQVSEMFAVKAGYTSISTASSAPTGFSTEPGQSDYVSWTRNTYEDGTGRLKHVDRYFDIPSSGTGTLSTNFYRTVTQYDALGRNEYTVEVVSGSSASDRKEQVTQNIYDVRDRVIEAKSGVSGDSAANSHNMTDDYTTYPTLRTISKTEYDSAVVGDGHITKANRYHGTGTNDFTGVNYKRTFRGHLRGLEPFYMNGSTETAIGPYTVYDLDWAGHTTSTALYDANPTWSSVLTGNHYSNYAASTATDRRTRLDTWFDDLGRRYLTRRYKIDASAGTGTYYMQDSTCFDRNNQPVAARNFHRICSETAYDGAGRAYQERVVLTFSSPSYSSGKYQYRAPAPNPTLGSMTGGDSLVLEMTHFVFDASANVTEEHTFEDNHDDAVTGSRGIDLTNNDDYVRRSVYRWYDAADRRTTTADYGSGDTTAGAGTWKYTTVPSRPGTAPTASSETALVTLFAYHADTGQQETVTDPAGHVTKSFFDDLGRTTYTAENYDNFNASTEANTGDGTDKSKDRVTKFTYNSLGQTKLIAMDANADGNLSDNQTTTYLFEDAVNAGRTTNEIYPDSSDTTSSGSDQVKLAYNVDGRLASRTDQRGTVIDYTYTGRRHLELTKVTTLGGSTDGHVRALKRSYDDLARIEKMTSAANSDGTGTVRNEIEYEYNDLSQVTKSYQSHEGAVNTGTTPKVQYAYDATISDPYFTRQHRLESVTYPDGRVIYYDYDASNASYPANYLPRVRRIRETNSTGAILAQYDYNGTSRLAIIDLQEPDVKLDFFQGTASTYAGYDRFARIKDQFWDGYGSTSDVDRFKYGYDYAGSRTYRDIDSSIYSTNNKDQAYTYDGLDRLKTSDEGTLSGSTISGTPTKEEDWTLDALGNWAGYVTKTSGSTDLNQSRTTNAVNEITGISETTGTAWIDPAYDPAGSMTTIPRPTNLSSGFAATYDAWNRLVKVVDGSNTVAEYEYDGLNRRIIKSIYASGSLDHHQHVYLNEQWQELEVRKEVSGTEDADPLEQFVWQPYYVDALLVRDYDADLDGNSARHYYTHDANFNVTAVIGNTGTVLERYHYTPYGQLVVLDADFAADADGQSDIANSVTFTGRHFDVDSGMYLFRNRQYHGQLGAFNSRDPSTYIDGRSLYSAYFVPHSVDPSGLNACGEGKPNLCTCCNCALEDAGRTGLGGLLQNGNRIAGSNSGQLCPIEMRCRKGCEINKGPSESPAFTKARVVGRNVRIDLCIDCRNSPDILQELLVHELIHAADFCDHPPGINDKESCEIFEGRAYRESCRLRFPDGGADYTRCVDCGIYFSCSLWGTPEPNPPCGDLDVPSKPCWRYDEKLRKFVADPDDPRCPKRQNR